MPSEKILKQKQESVAQLTQLLKSSVAGVLVDYKGINVADDTKMRKELREAGVHYSVTKNSILRRASENVGLEELKPTLVDSTALAISENDLIVTARIIAKYSEASKGKFTIKSGFVEGKVIDADGVIALAKLPSREELVAQALRGLNAPISGLATVLNGTIRSLVIALNAVAEKSA